MIAIDRRLRVPHPVPKATRTNQPGTGFVKSALCSLRSGHRMGIGVTPSPKGLPYAQDEQELDVLPSHSDCSSSGVDGFKGSKNLNSGSFTNKAKRQSRDFRPISEPALASPVLDEESSRPTSQTLCFQAVVLMFGWVVLLASALEISLQFIVTVRISTYYGRVEAQPFWGCIALACFVTTIAVAVYISNAHEVTVRPRSGTAYAPTQSDKGDRQTSAAPLWLVLLALLLPEALRFRKQGNTSASNSQRRLVNVLFIDLFRTLAGAIPMIPLLVVFFRREGFGRRYPVHYAADLERDDTAGMTSSSPSMLLSAPPSPPPFPPTDPTESTGWLVLVTIGSLGASIALKALRLLLSLRIETDHLRDELVAVELLLTEERAISANRQGELRYLRQLKGTMLHTSPGAGPIVGTAQDVRKEAPDVALAPVPTHGWEEFDTEGGRYYYHVATGLSTWERPAELGGTSSL